MTRKNSSKTRKDSNALFACENCGKDLGALGQPHLTNEPDGSQTWTCKPPAAPDVSTSEHTPTPWRVHRPGTYGIDVISEKAGVRVADCNPELGRDERNADIALLNAAFIVQAVNSYDSLRKAYEDLLAVCKLVFDSNGNPSAYAKQLMAAIAQAERVDTSDTGEK